MTNYFKSKIFIKQFLFFIVIIAATFSTISAALVFTTKAAFERHEIYMVENHMIQASQSVNSWFKSKEFDVKNQVLYLEAIDEANLSSKEIQNIIKDQISRDSSINDLLIIDKDGNIVNSKDGKLDFNISGADYFINGINGKATVTGFYKSVRTGTPVMSIVEPITINKKVQYVLVAVIELKKIKEVVEELNFGDFGQAYLIDGNGVIITSNTYINNFVNDTNNANNYSADSKAIQDLKNKKTGAGLYKDFSGEKVFGAYKWLEPLNLGLIVEFNEDNAMYPIMNFMKLIGYLAIVVLFVGIIMSYLLSKRIIRPINSLILATKKIIAGDYKETIKVKTDSELDILVNSFNKMQSIIKDREDELQKKNEALKIKTMQAIEANRLKGNFLANMSHELRTPLNSIIGFTTRVIKKNGDVLPEVDMENLKIVKDESYHLLSLINTLLDYSKLEAGKMTIHYEEFILEELISEVSKMISCLIEGKNLEYKVAWQCEESSVIVSDRIKVKQILINLLSNACKYSERGTITLSISIKENNYIINVQDEGIGIDEENIDKIFDEFRQVDGSYVRKIGGTGLGLSITKRFVELLGGKISVKSTKDLGSTFTVKLPMKQIEKNYDFEGSEGLNTKKIICVDDDLNVQRLYKQYLNDHGYEVITLTGEEEVTKIIEDVNPDIVILDIMLPNMDGWEILSELKSNPKTKKIPIVMASVLNEKNLAFKMHADDYLVKPITQEELISSIVNFVPDKDNLDIIVADDDENYIKLVSQFLEEEGFSYRVAANGEETLELIKERKPNILLLDVMMPKKDGLEVMQEISKVKEWNDISIIIVTAKNLSIDENNFIKKSTNTIIEKSGKNIDEVIKNLMNTMKDKINNGRQKSL